jgi:hypothetical protein
MRGGPTANGVVRVVRCRCARNDRAHPRAGGCRAGDFTSPVRRVRLSNKALGHVHRGCLRQLRREASTSVHRDRTSARVRASASDGRRLPSPKRLLEPRRCVAASLRSEIIVCAMRRKQPEQEYSSHDCGGPEACSGCDSYRHGLHEDGSGDLAAIRMKRWVDRWWRDVNSGRRKV